MRDLGSLQSSASRATLSLPQEVVRKALHLSVATIPLVYAFGVTRDVILVPLGAGVALAALVEMARRLSPGFRERFERTFGVLLRQHERTTITGATWLLSSCLVAVVVLPRAAAIAALWSASFGDPAAALAGRLVDAGRGVQRPGRKTLVGSTACFLASVAGAWALAHYHAGHAIAIALAATIAEWAPLPVDDNLRIIAAAGAAGWVFS